MRWHLPNNGPLRILIVDDEPLAIKNIQALVEAQKANVQVFTSQHGKEALSLLAENEIDILFLDVQMPEMSGFEVLENLVSPKWPVVVFVTAFDQHAVKAFEVNAVDYLLKPVRDERFTAAFRRAVNVVGQEDLEAKATALLRVVGAKPTAFLERIVVRTGSKVRILNVAEIDAFEAFDYYVKVHVGDQCHLVRESMKSLEDRLDPSRFGRVHRSNIINLDRILEVHESQEGEHLGVLTSGRKVPMSHSRWKKVQDSLKGSS